ADGLGSPPGRWQTRAALGRVLLAGGQDDEADLAFTESRLVINDVATGLSPERAERFLSADQIQEILSVE
ncbi:MAG: hypothetical protein LC808_33500, partial [Actinobacteria bacterium]|nr:hypothetical protein [Actinomycetota bacterium]